MQWGGWEGRGREGRGGDAGGSEEEEEEEGAEEEEGGGAEEKGGWVSAVGLGERQCCARGVRGGWEFTGLCSVSDAQELLSTLE